MTAAPLVSIFLFCRNGRPTIRRSVESVLAQSCPDFEYVIQDGASTDGTLEILRTYDDPRIQLRSEPDDGPASAFWRAIRRCRGRYIAACLSDEELMPDAIEEGVDALAADRDAVAVTRDAYLVDIEGRIVNTCVGRPFDLVDYLANRFTPNFAATMFRRQSLEAAGLYARTWDLDCGEFELWCRLAHVGPVRYLPGVVAKYGFHDGQLSRSPANAMRLARGRLRIIDTLTQETTLFDADPELLRTCRVATGLSFANHLLELKAHEEAAQLYLEFADESARLKPPRAETPANDYLRASRARGLRGDERLGIEILESARTIIPAQADLLCAIARTHAAAGQIDRALGIYDAALRITPDHHETHGDRALLLERRGLIDEALDAWRRSDLTRDARRHSLYLVACLKSPSSTNETLLTEHREWARLHTAPPLDDDAPPLASWRHGDKATVAYACSFWDADTITFQLLPILRRHDRSRFRVIAYTGAEAGPSIRAAVDEVRVVRGLSNHAFARRVRADGVHILMELNGHSPGHWFAAMAARCAPIQVSYLNYTSTCGVDEVDYIIGDEISVPTGSERLFTEEVYRLPGCFFCFTYEGAELPPVGPPPSATTGSVTFGCFGSGGKLNPRLLDLWANVLRATPGSRLFIRNGELTPADNRRALTGAFERRGIGGERLLILPGTNRQGVLESYGAVDISLDTFPYCGGNTIAESLWQGVPVVTLKGTRFSSAYGASLLTASGLEELVASTPEEYVQKAAGLAADAPRLVYYRGQLRSLVHRFGFSDADRFTPKLEEAYLDMLDRRFA